MKYRHLLGVPFVHGSSDCYEIIRRFYQDNFSIKLRPYARADGWWDAGLNLYMDNFEAEGFRTVDIQPHQAQPADIFLTAIPSGVANHAGIYLGNGEILHHYIGRLSEVVKVKGVWRNNLCAIIRHKDVVIPVEEITVDILDHILPHKRAAYLDAQQPQ